MKHHSQLFFFGMIFINVYHVVGRDYFRYNSRLRKLYKRTKHYTYFVEDHHCIPKEHRNHDLLRNVGFDINCSKNLVIMPNKLGKHAMNLHPKTIVHQGGHHKYNDYVLEKLDEILLYPTFDDQKYHFWLLLHFLKSNMQFNEDNIPWK